MFGVGDEETISVNEVTFEQVQLVDVFDCVALDCLLEFGFESGLEMFAATLT
jgi:hypothetical protein